jgi:integrase
MMSLNLENKTLRESIRMELKEYLLTKRQLSDKSLTAYVSTLSCLFNSVCPEAGELTVDKLPLLENVEAVLEVLNNHPDKYKKVTQKKSVLTALIVASNPELWKPTFDAITAEFKEKLDKQEMSIEQTKGWVDKEEIDLILKKLEKNANLLYKKGQFITDNDLQDIQLYIILCLYSGKYFQPRRSQDFIEFKVRNIDKTKDNYLDKSEMVFNTFKGRFVNVRGEVLEKAPQRIPVDPELKKILAKWIKVSKRDGGADDYLLFDKQWKQMNATQLNQRVNKIFGREKGCGINQMRHTALTEKYSHLIQDHKDLAEDMKAMGSSILEAKYYIQAPSPFEGADGCHPDHVKISEEVVCLVIDNEGYEPVIEEVIEEVIIEPIKKEVKKRVKKIVKIPEIEIMVSNENETPPVATPKMVRKKSVKKTGAIIIAEL